MVITAARKFFVSCRQDGIRTTLSRVILRRPMAASAPANRSHDDDFARLFTEYFPLVYHYVRGKVSTEEQAKDVAFLVFSRFRTHGTSLDFNRPLPHLVCRLTRLAMVFCVPGELRDSPATHEDRHPAASDEADEAGKPGEPPMTPDLNDAEREFLHEAQSDFIAHAMKELPSRCREVAVLHWCDQVSPAEIARRLRLPLAMVETHLARARERVWKPVVRRMQSFE